MRHVVALASLLLVAQTPSVRLSTTAIYQSAAAAVDRLTIPDYVAFTIESHSHQSVEDAFFSSQDEERVLIRLRDERAVVAPLRAVDGTPYPQRGPSLVVGPDYGAFSNVWALGDFPTANPGIGNQLFPGTDFFDAGPTRKGPAVIATVVAVNAPPYRIVDLGDGEVDGHAVYHLGLTPIHNATRFRLREIWIDKSTMLPMRYVAQRVVEEDIPFSYLVTVETVVIGGHLINVKLDGAFVRSGPNDVAINGVSSWRVFDVSFPAHEPDWVFDGPLWSKHIGERIPGLEPGTDGQKP